MASSGPLSLKDISNFLQSITSINNGGAFETDEQKQQCKAAIKALYGFGSRELREGSVWNWGFSAEEIDERIKKVLPHYSRVGTDGFSEQLYFFALHAIGAEDLSDKKLLDIGCGFGEGLNFVSRAAQLREIVGLDLCQEAIDRANSRLARRGLAYVCGDAENLPFNDGEMDIVINIESSHTYPDLARFLSEVERVLRPGGYFSYVDVFTEERYAALTQFKAKTGLAWTAETDITAAVKRAIQMRMRPDSFLRQTLRKKQLGQPILRLLSEPLELANFGADFIDYPYNPLQRLVRRAFWWMLSRSDSLPPLRFTRYMHNLALKL